MQKKYVLSSKARKETEEKFNALFYEVKGKNLKLKKQDFKSDIIELGIEEYRKNNRIKE